MYQQYASSTDYSPYGSVKEMTPESIRKYNIIDQILADHTKALALVENVVVTFAVAAMVFVVMEKTGITDSFLTAGLTGGTLASMAFFFKKMYCDEAFSEIITPEIHREFVERVILTLEYSKTAPNQYTPNKRMFSRFLRCQSELITIVEMKSHIKLTGPLHKIKKIVQQLKLSTF